MTIRVSFKDWTMYTIRGHTRNEPPHCPLEQALDDGGGGTYLLCECGAQVPQKGGHVKLCGIKIQKDN